MTISTNRESDRFMLRLPDGMRDRLKEEAAKNNRSMNAEIIARLEDSFFGPEHRLDKYIIEDIATKFPHYMKSMEHKIDMLMKRIEQRDEARASAQTSLPDNDFMTKSTTAKD